MCANSSATVGHSGLQPVFQEDAEQVEQDGVVAVPGVEQRLEQALVRGFRHIHTRLLRKSATDSRFVGGEYRIFKSDGP
jgi:hypothetical protein